MVQTIHSTTDWGINCFANGPCARQYLTRSLRGFKRCELTRKARLAGSVREAQQRLERGAIRRFCIRSAFGAATPYGSSRTWWWGEEPLGGRAGKGSNDGTAGGCGKLPQFAWRGAGRHGSRHQARHMVSSSTRFVERRGKEKMHAEEGEGPGVESWGKGQDITQGAGDRFYSPRES